MVHKDNLTVLCLTNKKNSKSYTECISWKQAIRRFGGNLQLDRESWVFESRRTPIGRQTDRTEGIIGVYQLSIAKHTENMLADVERIAVHFYKKKISAPEIKVAEVSALPALM